MKKLLLRIYVIFFILITTHNDNVEDIDRVHEMRQLFCRVYEPRATKACNREASAYWWHALDVTNHTKASLAINATMDVAKFHRKFFELYLKEFDLMDIQNRDLLRQIQKASNIGYAALRPELMEELMKILTQMQDIYNTAKICPYQSPKCNLTTSGISLIPEIDAVMCNSMDYDELLYTWIAWHDATGAKLRKPFEYYVVLANEAAIANNFTDRGEMWRNEFEVDNLEEIVDRLWDQVEPLYTELQTYVRHRLREIYHKEMDRQDDGLIPAHLLGNMWAQNWLSLKDLVVPYPNDTSIDITETFNKQNFPVLKMFQMANDFFKSMGLLPMDDAFDVSKGAIIEKPAGNQVVACHASAWDFCNGSDFRIKMCAQSTFHDFITIHHELGHIQYFMWYKHQPILYRAGANPSFHEAIGDMLALSVITPKHFQRLNLIPEGEVSEHNQVNMLMNMALVKVAFLPYAYILDKWRWDIFAEKIDPEKWNEHFWAYRIKYQKVKPPIVRTNDDFDPGAKFHIGSDTQYMSYFLANFMSFQIHKALCQLRPSYSQEKYSNFKEVPIHECDLEGNELAGTRLKHALKRGASKHWSFVLEDLTGHSYISAWPLLEYFDPLMKFLQKSNKAYQKYKLEDI